MIVLDTHVLVWWAADKAKLSRRARAAIESAKRRLVADISLWELAMMVSKGRLLPDRDLRTWIDQLISLPGIEIRPIRSDIAVRSTQLAQFHGDPADRLIVATALAEGAPLVTRDERIRKWAGVTSIW